MKIPLDSQTVQKISDVLDSNEMSIVQMAVDIGEDPQTFFEFGDWSGIDFRHSDISRVSFRGARLDGVKIFQSQQDLMEATNPKSMLEPQVFGNVTVQTKDVQTARLIQAYDVYRNGPGLVDAETLHGSIRHWLAKNYEVEKNIGIPASETQWRMLRTDTAQPKIKLSTHVVKAIHSITGVDVSEKTTPGLPRFAYELAHVTGVDFSPSDEMAAVAEVGEVSINFKVGMFVPLYAEDVSDVFEGPTNSESIGEIRFALRRANLYIETSDQTQTFVANLGGKEPKQLVLGNANLRKTGEKGGKPQWIIEPMDAGGTLNSRIEAKRLASVAFSDEDETEILVGVSIKPADIEVTARTTTGRSLRLSSIQKEAAISSLFLKQFPQSSSGEYLIASHAARIGNTLSTGLSTDDSIWFEFEGARSSDRVHEMYSKAWRQIRISVGLGRMPSLSTIEELMACARGTFLAEHTLRLLSYLGVGVRVRELNLLLTRCSNFDDAEKFLDLFRTFGLSPNPDSFSRLAQKATSFTEALSVVNLADEQGVAANRSIFNRIMVRAGSANDAFHLLRMMLEHNVGPNVATFNSALSKSKTLEQARELFGEMSQLDVKANTKTYNRLISKTKEFTVANENFQNMTEQGLHPDSETIKLMVRRADTGKQALNLIETAKELGVSVPLPAYAKSVQIAKGPVLQKIIDYAIFDGVWFTTCNLGRIIDRHRTDFSDARAFRENDMSIR